MAGDWIKMRVDLHDDPAVISMSAKLGVNQDEIVGKLMRIWKWFNVHTRDGNARGVTEAFIDTHIRLAGFADAMSEVGWLTIEKVGVRMPHFDRHCSNSAKERALSNIRVKRFRNGDTVTKALPEKRREEKKKDPPNPPQPQTAAAEGGTGPLLRRESERRKTARLAKEAERQRRLDEHAEILRRLREESA